MDAIIDQPIADVHLRAQSIWFNSSLCSGYSGIISPIDGTTTNPDLAGHAPLAIPEFKWTSVEGATTYRLQVSRDIGFTTTAVNITTTNTSYTPISVNAFLDGIWYWQVRVETPAPAGAYSSTWSFTKN